MTTRNIVITETVEELNLKLADLKIKESNFDKEFEKITNVDGIMDVKYLEKLDRDYHDTVDEIYIIEEKINMLVRYERQKGIDKNELYLVGNNID